MSAVVYVTVPAFNCVGVVLTVRVPMLLMTCMRRMAFVSMLDVVGHPSRACLLRFDPDRSDHAAFIMAG